MKISNTNKAGKVLPVFLLISVLFTMGVLNAHAQNSSADSNIMIQENVQPSVAQELLSKLMTSWPWYLTRASGLVATLALFILMLSGVGFITGHSFKFLEPITAWATHRALGIVLGIATLIHISALYFDNFVPFNMKELLIPFASSYKPIEVFGIYLGSFYVALGILSLYIFAGIILTSLFWIDKKPSIWKWMHLSSYIATFLIFLHALYLGTDLASGFMRWLWIILGISMLVASLARLWRARTV